MTATAPLTFPYTEEDACAEKEPITLFFATNLAKAVNHLYYRLTGDTYSGAIAPAGGLTAHDHSGSPNGRPMPRNLCWGRHDVRKHFNGVTLVPLFEVDLEPGQAGTYYPIGSTPAANLPAWGKLLVSPGAQKVTGSLIYSLTFTGASAIEDIRLADYYLFARLRKTSGVPATSRTFKLPLTYASTYVNEALKDLSQIAYAANEESGDLVGVEINDAYAVDVDGGELNDLTLEVLSMMALSFRLKIWGYNLYELPRACAPAGELGGFLADNDAGTYPGAGVVGTTPITD